jgi:hypothetical protein
MGMIPRASAPIQWFASEHELQWPAARSSIGNKLLASEAEMSFAELCFGCALQSSVPMGTRLEILSVANKSLLEFSLAASACSASG